MGSEMILCLEAIRGVPEAHVHGAAEFLYVHLVNIPAADTLRSGLAADAEILTGEHVASLLKACGDELARDAPRVLPILRLWRQSLVGLVPEPDLEAEQQRAQSALAPRLAQLEAIDWRQACMCLGLHLTGVPDELRREMRSCSTLNGLWALLVDAVASVETLPALESLLAEIEQHVGLQRERPAWIQQLKKRDFSSLSLAASASSPLPSTTTLLASALPATPSPGAGVSSLPGPPPG
jgi:hypothetical protein